MQQLLATFAAAAAAAAFVVNTVTFATQIYAGSFYGKTPYHTSVLTSEMWVADTLLKARQRYGEVGSHISHINLHSNCIDLFENLCH